MSQSRVWMLAVLAMLGLAGQAWAADALEGKWSVTLTPEEPAAGKEIADTLEFKATQFTSEYFKKLAFAATAYEADTRRYGPTKFTATQKEDKAGTLEWSGMLTAGELSGRLVWTKKDGSTIIYTFKGEKAKSGKE